MQAVSSNQDFNAAIQAVKAPKRKSKAEKGKEPYQYIISSERKKKAFVAEIAKEKAAKKEDLVDKPAEENQEEE